MWPIYRLYKRALLGVTNVVLNTHIEEDNYS